MRKSNNDRGFTVIELVLVIVVVAIIALAAAPRLVNITGVKASATARRLQSDIAYTQNLAMTSNRRHRVVFPSTNSYEVRDAAGVLATNPDGGGVFAVTTDSGITLSWSLNGDAALNRGVEFDSLGRPYFYDGVTTPSTTNLTAGEIKTWSGGTQQQTVTVQPQTGKVSAP
ncbi:MAG: GspH/FimT family pseudopilin [Nitrospiria bacterium]